MNTNKIYYWLMVAALVFTLNACEEEEPDTSVSVITVENPVENDFDVYLKNLYTAPYNIRFLYRMEDIESDMNYWLVPANYENSVKMANLVEYMCLDSYKEVAPDGFLERYFPKMIMLVGSPAYQNNGTMVIGTAEGGLKITLYNINNLDVTNTELLFEHYFRTIFHEFSHILHQTIDYSTDFDRISATQYVGDAWNEAWDTGESLKAGFISDYSSKEANEDFVELIAHYITHTEERWNELMEIAGESGSQIIGQKIDIVSSYLEQSWDIDIDALRDAILQRADNLSEQDLDNITIN
nr:putative zinc-binding metallopeptidase [uncultured Draconibacterium sp.]